MLIICEGPEEYQEISCDILQSVFFHRVHHIKPGCMLLWWRQSTSVVGGQPATAAFRAVLWALICFVFILVAWLIPGTIYRWGFGAKCVSRSTPQRPQLDSCFIVPEIRGQRAWVVFKLFNRKALCKCAIIICIGQPPVPMLHAFRTLKALRRIVLL